MAQRDKIDRTITRSLDMVEKLEKLFGNNGAFEQAVAEIGGDIAWFGDVRENLKTLYGNIEELHMGAVGHIDIESVEEAHQAATCGCGSGCGHCGGVHTMEEIGESCDCCGNTIKVIEVENKELSTIKKLAGI